jgi:DNA mismatch repair protein MutL
MLSTAAEIDFARAGLPEPPPWKREPDYEPPAPGMLRVSGFVSKPDLQKLNRNSIYIFVNGRLIRDRLILHGLTEAYRNIIPPTSFPVVLLFLEMPAEEVDVNVHPAKTEVRFRQSAFIHDFVRDTVRNTLMHARPVANFLHALQHNSPLAGASLLVDVSPLPGDPATPAAFDPSFSSVGFGSESVPVMNDAEPFHLAPAANATTERLQFGQSAIAVGYEAPSGLASDGEEQTLNALSTLRPLGQLRNSFILAVNEEGLWIVDQHVAHERVLFEKILRDREVERVQRQRLLMPLLIDVPPAQMVTFARLATELEKNGFEAEPFGPGTIAVKAAPVGLEGRELERMVEEVLAVPERELQAENAHARQHRIAASIACHAAIKINTPLEPEKIDWLLAELARTEHPTSCPHGRPIALRYSLKDIQKAFQRI